MFSQDLYIVVVSIPKPRGMFYVFFNVSISIVLCLKHLFELYNINALKTSTNLIGVFVFLY